MPKIEESQTRCPSPHSSVPFPCGPGISIVWQLRWFSSGDLVRIGALVCSSWATSASPARNSSVPLSRRVGQPFESRLWPQAHTTRRQRGWGGCQLMGAIGAHTTHRVTSSTAPADTSKSTGRSGRQKAATRRNMRREERVTVQGPVKEQQPDGMSHEGCRSRELLQRLILARRHRHQHRPGVGGDA